MYAFRFLRASYSLGSDHHADTHAAIQNLRAIESRSSQQRDVGIFMAASLIEAMAHLKSNAADSIEQAQRAIAAARTHQVDKASQLPQLTGLAHILDVVCSIKHGNPQIMLEKLKAMQLMMDGIVSESSWNGFNDAVSIPINSEGNKSTEFVSRETRAVVDFGDDGRDTLTLTFLGKKDAFSLT